jgi:hypothetical protein
MNRRPSARIPAAAAAAALAACASPQPRPVPVLEVAIGGSAETGCRMVVEGRSLDAAEFQAYAASWPARPRRAHLAAAGPDTPYRCIGGAIDILQRAGFREVGFLSAPAAE